VIMSADLMGGVVSVPAPGLPRWRLTINSNGRAAALEWRPEDAWLSVQPEVPVPGHLLIVHNADPPQRHYELTWRDARYVPMRHEIRHAVWLLLPSLADRGALALVRSLAAACEQRPVQINAGQLYGDRLPRAAI
jgi:hypothetical protein